MPKTAKKQKSPKAVNNWRNHFRTEVEDHKNVHYCNDCPYSTTVQKSMEFHVRVHMRHLFPHVCTELNCDKAFKTKPALVEHSYHHKCGFGIEAMKDIGICGESAIKGHYEMVVVDNKFRYQCTWPECQYVISLVDHIQTHVHSQHVCPYRQQLDGRPARQSQ